MYVSSPVLSPSIGRPSPSQPGAVRLPAAEADSIRFSGKAKPTAIPPETLESVQAVLSNYKTTVPRVGVESLIADGFKLIEGQNEDQAAPVRKILEEGRKLLDPQAMEAQFKDELIQRIAQQETVTYSNTGETETRQAAIDLRRFIEQTRAEKPELSGEELIRTAWDFADEKLEEYKKTGEEYHPETSNMQMLKHTMNDLLRWYFDNVKNTASQPDAVLESYLWGPLTALNKDVQRWSNETKGPVTVEERSNPLAQAILDDWGQTLAENVTDRMLAYHQATLEIERLTGAYADSAERTRASKQDDWDWEKAPPSVFNQYNEHNLRLDLDAPGWNLNYMFVSGKHHYWKPTAEVAQKLVNILLETPNDNVRESVLKYLWSLREDLPEVSDMVRTQGERAGEIAREKLRDKQAENHNCYPADIDLLLNELNDPLYAMAINEYASAKETYEPLAELIRNHPDPLVRLKGAYATAVSGMIPAGYKRMTLPEQIDADLMNLWQQFQKGDRDISERIFGENIYQVLASLGRKPDAIGAIENAVTGSHPSTDEERMKAFKGLIHMAYFTDMPEVDAALGSALHHLLKQKSDAVFLQALSQYEIIPSKKARNDSHQAREEAMERGEYNWEDWKDDDSRFLAKYVQDLKPFAARLDNLVQKIPEDTACSCGIDDTKSPHDKFKPGHWAKTLRERKYVKLRETPGVNLHILKELNKALQIDYKKENL